MKKSGFGDESCLFRNPCAYNPMYEYNDPIDYRKRQSPETLFVGPYDRGEPWGEKTGSKLFITLGRIMKALKLAPLSQIYVTGVLRKGGYNIFRKLNYETDSLTDTR